MRRIVAGLAITLDGVTQSPSDWLMRSPEFDEAINAGLDQADAVLLGRTTFLEFAQLWPAMGDSFPMAAFLNSAPKYVVSSTLTSTDWAGSTILSGDLREELTALKQQPGRDITIPGSPSLVRSLLLEGLLDELGLMLHPLVLGSGTRLFPERSDRVELDIVESRTLGNGVLHLTYRPKSR